MTGTPEGGAPGGDEVTPARGDGEVPDVDPSVPPLTGLDLARSALSAARARAREDGLRPRAGAGGRGRGDGRRSRTLVRRRGVPVDPDEQVLSGPGPDDRDPQPLESTVARIASEHGWAAGLAVGGVVGRWAEVVGAEMAAHCEPESFDDGVLVIRTDSTAWATQVRLLAPTLVRRLAEEVGHGVVRRVVVRGPQAPSWRKGSLHVKGRGPRDTYG